jgi:type IV pilus assembly protein PilV
MKPLQPSPSASGFSLVEVLVALVVFSVGLLGIAKMQALGLSSTSVAGKRALAATQADSLAAAMHENRGYWTSAAAVGTWTAATGAVPACVPGAAAPCTSDVLAAYDLQVWAQNLSALLPNANGTIVCQATTPVTCLVTITWSETTLAINTQGQAAAQAATGTNFPTYTLFVEP